MDTVRFIQWYEALCKERGWTISNDEAIAIHNIMQPDNPIEIVSEQYIMPGGAYDRWMKEQAAKQGG